MYKHHKSVHSKEHITVSPAEEGQKDKQMDNREKIPVC